LIRFQLKILQVTGASMSPYITDKSYILVFSPWNFLLDRKPILCFQHHNYGKIIKRLKTFRNNQFWFESDNPEGINSGQIGPVSKEEIIGRVLIVLKN
jgi:nickel-type superoxide dismutase maturation protease